MKKQLVSIIIPTKNSGLFLENCLKSIKEQSYKNIEIIIVDGDSLDSTTSLAKKYNAKFFIYNTKVKSGIFDAPHKRNYGVQKAEGDFVYYVDADMELSKGVIEEAVLLLNSGSDAAIIKEDSFGVGVWARAKQLERRCYWGDDTVEAPRFFKKVVWDKLGGLDETLGGGGDDWDLYQKLLEKGYLVARTKSLVRHNEGNLKLWKLMKKRFMYGRDSFRYISKRPVAGTKSYFPIRKAYLRNWKLFLARPFDAAAFIFMRFMEYSAGLSGILYALIKR
jgi:glycosyltransferase involved in cell wall biosynthesis